MKVDILNASKRIAIEVQGKQHTHFNRHFHQNRMNFWFAMRRDSEKANWLEKNGFAFIELIEEDLEKLSPKFIIDKFGVNII